MTFCHVLRPELVKSNVTFGAESSSKFCSGFLMSVPRGTGLSFRTYHWSVFCLALSLDCSARRMTVPSGTFMVVSSGYVTPSVRNSGFLSAASQSDFSAEVVSCGPQTTVCCLSATP